MKYVAEIIGEQGRVKSAVIPARCYQYNIVARDTADKSLYEEYNEKACIGFGRKLSGVGYACCQDARDLRFLDCISEARTVDEHRSIGFFQSYETCGDDIFVNTGNEIVTVLNGSVVVRYVDCNARVCTVRELFLEFCRKTGVNIMRYNKVQFVNRLGNPEQAVFVLNRSEDAYLNKLYMLEVL